MGVGVGVGVEVGAGVGAGVGGGVGSAVASAVGAGAGGAVPSHDLRPSTSCAYFGELRIAPWDSEARNARTASSHRPWLR